MGYGGRPKGSPNHRSLEARRILEEENFCPLKALLKVHRLAIEAYENNKGLMPGKIDNRDKYLNIAESSANNLTKYVYPTLKAIEHSANEDTIKSMRITKDEILKALQHDPAASNNTPSTGTVHEDDSRLAQQLDPASRPGGSN